MASNAENVSIWWRHHDSADSAAVTKTKHGSYYDLTKDHISLSQVSYGQSVVRILWEIVCVIMDLHCGNRRQHSVSVPCWVMIPTSLRSNSSTWACSTFYLWSFTYKVKFHGKFILLSNKFNIVTIIKFCTREDSCSVVAHTKMCTDQTV